MSHRAQRRKTLAHGTGSMLVSQVLRAGLQAAFFLLLTRSLGIDSFGLFAGIVALIAVVSPFASLGTPYLGMQNVVDDPGCAGTQFMTGVFVSAVVGVPILGILCLFYRVLLPHGATLTMVLCIGVADLLCMRFIDNAAFIYQGLRRTLRAAHYFAWMYAGRMAAALVVAFSPVRHSITAWAIAYVGASVVFSAGLLITVFRDIGFVRHDIGAFRRQWKVGVLYSVQLSSQTVYNDIDKTMLARLGTTYANGVYSAAYRFVDLAHTPMRAILGAAYPEFFRRGRDGLGASVRYAGKVAPAACGYGLAASLALYFGAGLIPDILGNSYRSSIGALHGLALIPLLRSFHYLAGDALSGARQQAWRTAFQVGIAVVNVLANLWLIPEFSWHGAVIASIASDGLLAVSLWVLIWVRLHRERRPVAQQMSNV